MKYKSYIWIAAVLAMVSCSSNDLPGYTDEPFKVGEVGYTTLQEAVKAAKRQEDGVVTLMKNAAGEGAVVQYDSTSVATGITLDVQSYTYTLLSGSSITADCGTLTLKGDGGRILSTDGTPLLVLEDNGEAIFTDDISIMAKTAIQAEDSYVMTSGFRGTFKGNITLDESAFVLSDSACSIVADTLAVYGEDAVFDADTNPYSSHNTVTIGKIVSSDNDFPVTATSAGVISVKDGQIHVHNFSASKIAATCITDEMTLNTCNECGRQTPTHTGIYGSCPKEGLVHHEALAATELDLGNIEYWDCPLCGRTFTDANAENVAEEGVVILPGAYILGDSLLQDKNWIQDWQSLEYPYQEQAVDAIPAFVPIIAFTVGTINMFWGIAKSISGNNNKNWEKAFNMLDQIKGKLEKVDQKIDDISKQLKDLPYLLRISDRKSDLCAMKSNIYSYARDFNRHLQAQKYDSLRIDATNFANLTYGGVSYPDMVKVMMQKFYTGEIGESKLNYPQMWENYTNGMCRWEHDGYTFRAAVELNDVVYLSFGWLMSYYYYTFVKKYDDKEHLRIDTLEMKDIYTRYTKTSLASMDRMKTRLATLRRFNSLNTSFKIKPYDVTARNYFNWFDRHWWYTPFPRDNENGKAVSSCNTMLWDNLRYPGEKTYMTPDQAKKIYDVCNSGKKDKKSIYYLLGDTLQASITWPVRSYKEKLNGMECILCGPFKCDFGHYNDDNAKPHYNMFAWESYRRDHHDSFGIKGWRNDASTGVDNIIYDADISTYGKDKGQIVNRGKMNNYIYRSVEVYKE